MRLSPTLLRSWLRPALPATLVAVCVLGAMLFYRDILANSAWTALFAAAHCWAIALLTGGLSRAGWFAFLHTRGFPRSVLFWHCNLAAVLNVLVVLAAAALLFATPLRSQFQDNVLQNPYGPFIFPKERVQLFWLAGSYVVLLPVVQYSWIRWAQPDRGGGNGVLLAVALVFVWAGVAAAAPRWPLSIAIAACVVGASVALSALWAAARAYGRLEVRP